MLRNFKRKVFSYGMEENEDVIDAAPEVSANGEGVYDMSTPELENEKEGIIELEGDLDDTVDVLEETCDDCETVIQIDNIVKDSVDSNNGLDTTSVNIINTTIESIIRRHGLTRVKYRIPSLEKYGKTLDRVKQAKVTLEGVGDFFKWLWKKIKAIWESIAGFFKKLFGNSVNLFRKEITKARDMMKAIHDKKGILSENIPTPKSLGDLIITCSKPDDCALMAECKVENKASEDGKKVNLVDPQELFGVLKNASKGVEDLMDKPINIALTIDNATLTGGILGEISAAASNAQFEKVDENHAFINQLVSICRAFNVPGNYTKYMVKSKDFKEVLDIGIIPEYKSGLIDDYMKLINGLYDAAKKAKEDEIEKLINGVEDSQYKALEKGLKEDLDEEKRKEAIENAKKTAKEFANLIKGLYGYIRAFSGVVVLVAANVSKYIEKLESLKKSDK